MSTLTITLTPEAVGKLHDALLCLGKFGESVSLEARKTKVSHILTIIIQRLVSLILLSAGLIGFEFFQVRSCIFHA